MGREGGSVGLSNLVVPCRIEGQGWEEAREISDRVGEEVRKNVVR